LLLKLVLAVVLGGIVGLERELLEKPAGLRTNILICLGAAIFTHLSSYLTVWGSPDTPADPSRIASQIVSGIGFLGAGAIIQSRAHVKGLTTAATIWVVAAIGMAVGAAAYGLAVGGTVLILLILVGLGALERRVVMGWAEIVIEVELRGDSDTLSRIRKTLEDRGLRPWLQEASREPSEEHGRARLRTKIANSDLEDVVEELFRLPEVLEVRPK
jgi:putative Mg2+ transporter-C (MgtC) family protein